MAREIQRFHVGLKAFLLDAAGRLLLLRESSTGLWELPGGRIDVGEELLPQESILRRELNEELGTDVKIDVGPLALTWVRQRAPGDFVFLVGRRCALLSGAIRLSDEHSELAWVDRAAWRTYKLADGYSAALEEFWHG